MALSQRSHEGYLLVDHRASPGISEEKALQLGYEPFSVKEGAVLETATMQCNHCGTQVILNPGRTRSRGFCYTCNRYICDWCEAARHQPDYVHRTIGDVAELVLSGKLSGVNS